MTCAYCGKETTRMYCDDKCKYAYYKENRKVAEYFYRIVKDAYPIEHYRLPVGMQIPALEMKGMLQHKSITRGSIVARGKKHYVVSTNAHNKLCLSETAPTGAVN